MGFQHETEHENCFPGVLPLCEHIFRALLLHRHCVQDQIFWLHVDLVRNLIKYDIPLHQPEMQAREAQEKIARNVQHREDSQRRKLLNCADWVLGYDVRVFPLLAGKCHSNSHNRVLSAALCSTYSFDTHNMHWDEALPNSRRICTDYLCWSLHCSN